jgi:flagellar basal-body rod modification protein FlgD
MSTIDPISQEPAAVAGSPQADGFSQLSSEEFTKIIFTELGNQDPLEPNDTSALLEQLSMLRSIQSDIDMMDRLSSIVDQNELAGASNLIGKLVSGIDESNERVLDFVLSVSRTSDGAVLNLEQGGRVAMEDVDEIIDPIVLVPPEGDEP